jgi:hypothetical protein
MARKAGLERLLTRVVEEISAGVRQDLQTYLDERFGRIEKRLRGGAAGPSRGNGRGGGRGRVRSAGRVVRTPAEIEGRRKKILKIVGGEPKGITSKDVAVRMRTDPRGVGKLLAGLHRDKKVKKDGDLYLPA